MIDVAISRYLDSYLAIWLCNLKLIRRIRIKTTLYVVVFPKIKYHAPNTEVDINHPGMRLILHPVQVKDIH